MFRFFKNMRRGLLKEGRVKTYLGYALGEILLVVIGILIALSINNRSQYIKDRKTEVFVLNSIRSNLNEDIGALYKIIYSNQQLLARLDTASTILNDSAEWPVGTLTASLESFNEIYAFTTNRTGIDQLISSSQMEIIRSRQLVEQLLLYYRDIEENAKGNEMAAIEYSQGTFGPKLLSYDRVSAPQRPLSDYRKDPFFSNAVAFKQKNTRLMMAEYLGIQKKAQKLSSLINEELKRLE